MSKIIIGFSGWVEADPDSIRFQYIGPVRESQMIIITGTECCRPKRRNIYSPRSMNLKTKELKRRQPKDESEI